MRLPEFSGIWAALAIFSGCQATAPASSEKAQSIATAQPVREEAATASPVPVATPSRRQRTFLLAGELEQGGWIRGQAPEGARSAKLGSTELELDQQGRFFAAFDRDAGASMMLTADLKNGDRIERSLTIAPRDWDIEHVDVARRPSGMTEAFWKIRKPELEQIAAARAADAESYGWSQDFVWPVRGRISGRFGAQRIYRGEPGSYHSGLDIAPGAGAPFVAPADGVVTLAAREPFSLEGHLIIIDHGQGLNSAFLHAAEIAVEEGQLVRQGERLGTVGMSGRATGPHLHWSLKWRDARLDPLLFVDRVR